MTKRWLAGLAALALGACGDEDASPRSPEPRLFESTRATCAVGERPGYFVPGDADAPLALLGCARLGFSGKRVEFSANVARIDGSRYACVNPAYGGRGRRGLYIPAICKLEPALSRFAVRRAAQPRQGVRGYGYMIWGTAGASTEVVASFTAGRARAAVFRVSPGLAGRFGESEFGVFVMELPLSAACRTVTVSGEGPGAAERIPPQSRLCERGRGIGAGSSR